MKKLKAVIIGIICIGLCAGYYFYISNYNNDGEKRLTQVEQVITKDLEKSYPSSPREVIKFYNRLLICLYNEKYTEEQLEKMGEQARRLMDDELLSQNPEQEYLLSLQSDIEKFEKEKKEIISSKVSSSANVEYKEVNGSKCAYVEASYFVKGKNNSERLGQTYILRKNEADQWKILGYYQP